MGSTPHRDGDPERTDPAGGADILPFRPRRQDVTRHWHVEQADTEPMTPGQYTAAVAALAELITDWQQQGAPATTPKKAA